MIARGCQDNKSSAVMALYVLLYMKEHKIKLPYSLDAYMGTSYTLSLHDALPLFLYQTADFQYAVENAEVSMVSLRQMTALVKG